MRSAAPQVGFGKVPNERFNPARIGVNTVYREVHARFYLKFSKNWEALPQRIFSFASIAGAAWQESLRTSVIVSDDGYLAISAFTGFDPDLGGVVTKTFDDDRLMPLKTVKSEIHVGSNAFAGQV